MRTSSPQVGAVGRSERFRQRKLISDAQLQMDKELTSNADTGLRHRDIDSKLLSVKSQALKRYDRRSSSPRHLKNEHAP